MEKKPKLEFTMAVENLRDTCDQIERLEAEYKSVLDRLYHERNLMLDDAVEIGVPIRHLMAIANLSRERIYQVRQSVRPKQ